MKCCFHPKKDIRFECISCGGTELCKSCYTVSHSDHFIRNLREYDKLTDGHYTKARQVVKIINGHLEEIEVARNTTAETTETDINKVRNRAKQLEHYVNTWSTEMISKLQDLNKKKSESIDSFEVKLRTYADKLKCLYSQSDKEKTSVIQTCQQDLDEILSTNIRIIDNSRFDTLNLVIASDSEADIYHMFGELQESIHIVDNTETKSTDENTSEPADSDLNGSRSTLDKGYISGESSSDVNGFFHDNECIIRSFSSYSEKGCWLVRESNSTTITEAELVSISGELDCCYSLDTGVLDIASSFNGTIVCCTDRSIRELHDDGSNTVSFRTRHRPESICFLDNNSIVTCYFEQGQIMKLDENGREISRFERGLYTAISQPFRVRSNFVNDRIAVLNADPYSLILLDADLNLKFVFDGKLTYLPGEIHKAFSRACRQRSSVFKFGPNDVCFDVNDNILITDAVTRSVVMLNTKGGALRSITPVTSYYPSAVFLDWNQILWIGYCNGFVKVFDYQQLCIRDEPV